MLMLFNSRGRIDKILYFSRVLSDIRMFEGNPYDIIRGLA